MPTYAPGPSTERPPFPELRPVILGTPFSDAGRELVAALQAGRSLFDDRLRSMGSLSADDLSGDFRSDVAPALEQLAQLQNPATDPELAGAAGVFEETIENLLDLSTSLPSPFDDEGGPGIPELPPPPGSDKD